MAQEVALTKRIKISKAQQNMFLAVLIASLVLGFTIMLSVFFVKYIIFNTKVINAKEQAISNYKQTIKNVGICKADKNGDIDLEKCNPNDIVVEDIPNSLRYNVMVNMANNKDLDSVSSSSGSEEDCYEDGEKVDYSKKYAAATSESDRKKYLGMVKMCSSLRVIPDALPAQKNDEALMASLNQIFLLSGWTPESLAPSGKSDTAASNVSPGIGTIPVSVAVKASSSTVRTVLSNIERSIRDFSIGTASIGWSADNVVNFTAQATAFYSSDLSISEFEDTIYADDSKNTKNTQGIRK